MSETLVDRIYEASVIPELWPEILEDLGVATQAKGGMLFAVRDRVLSWTASEQVHEAFGTYIADGWFRRCGRRICLFEKAHSSFMTELDYWTQEELAQNEIYRDFFYPRDLGWSAGTGLSIPTGDHIVFSIESAYSGGPIQKKNIELLNELRPHIARSAVISARLGLKSAQSSKETLAALGVPTLLLTADGIVVDQENITDEVSACLAIGGKNRLSLKDITADNILHTALSELSETSPLTGRSFPVRDENDQAALVAHLLPINRSANDIFAQAYALLAMIPIASKSVPPVELVRSLFDFTASEANVARGLATGDSVEQIADRQGVSVNTIRTHVRKVLEKSGCSRQPELVALLNSISIDRE